MFYVITLNIFTVIVDCKVPSVPANGTVSFTNGTKYGARADFGCDTGFRLVGNANSACHLSGRWEPGNPDCQLIGFLY